MKRILFLAPYSIPINNPEAICNAKLLKVLSDAGYLIDVISKNNLLAYAPNSDDQLFTNKLSSIKTFFLSNKISIRTIVDHLRVLLKTGYVYKGAHWAIYAINYAEKLIQENKYDWIMSRSPASELAALYLSQKYSIKWIANWNDPYPEKRMPEPYASGILAKLTYWERKLLEQVSEKAYLHTFASERLRDYMLQYMKNVPLEKTMVIPHICIKDLFVPQSKERSNKLILIHSGNVSAPRNPVPFFEGLRFFLQSNREAEILVYFIGKESNDFQNHISEFDLEDYVKVVPPLNYLDNLIFIEQADITLLIEAPSQNSIFLPTKVGDYMQASKEIFAISPLVGTLNDLYREGFIEYFADCTDSLAISKELSKIYSNRDLYIKENRRRDIIENFTSNRILEIYTKILG